MTTQQILAQLQSAFGFELTLIEDVEAYMNVHFPPSYLEVMTPAEEMIGAMYTRHAFTDAEGKLVGLNLYDCGLSSDQVSILEELPLDHLRTLSIAQNELSHFSLTQHMTALQYADLSQNQSLQLLGLDSACTQLARLELADCQLAGLTIPATYEHLFYLDLSRNPTLTVCELEGELASLQVLHLRGTGLTELALPDHFPELVYLFLNDSERLQHLYIEKPLPKLDTLQLRGCGLEDFSEEYLHLGDAPVSPEDFWPTFRAYFPAASAVYIGRNPIKDSVLATKLQDEDNSSNLDTLVAHYRQREAGLERDNECKVLLIGNGKAGKTNILRRMTKGQFNPRWDSTHGITIQNFPTQGFELYFWDFGGQDIYHNTHRLFMQRDAVYVLAWRQETETNEQTEHEITQSNGRPLKRNYPNYKLNYWLNYAKQLGHDSPMIVVQTNIKEDQIDKSREGALRAKFEGSFEKLLAFCYVESLEKEDKFNSYRDLRKYLLQGVKAIKGQRPIAKPLYELRKYLRDLQAQKNGPKRLSLADYKAKAEELGVDDPKRELRTWLHRTGVVYHQPKVFNGDIVLDQEWVINAIYALFDRSDQRLDQIKEQRGEFTGAKLQEIWAGQYDDQEVQALLVDFMLSCDICFEVETHAEEGSHHRVPFAKRRFIAPKLLPERKPSMHSREWQREIHAAKGQPYYLRYQFNFLHEKVIEAIIARTAYLADMPWLMWQSGTRITSDEDPSQALYIERVQNELYLQAKPNSLPLIRDMHELIEELQGEKPRIQLSEDGEAYQDLDKSHSLAQAISQFYQIEPSSGGKEADTFSAYRGEAAPNPSPRNAYRRDPLTWLPGETTAASAAATR